MIRHLLAAAALLAAIPVQAQSQQDELDASYDRALAAGYKALFLCSAIANAERAGVERTPASVERWELTGIQAPLDGLVGELPYKIFRTREGTGAISHVSVAWSDAMPPRLAWHEEAGGCSLGPIGARQPPERDSVPVAPEGTWRNHSELILKGGIARAFAGASSGVYGEGTRTTALVVADSDRERYWKYYGDFGPATPQRTWSVAKSIAATLMGAAAQRGDLDFDTASRNFSASPEIPLIALAGAEGGHGRSSYTLDHMLRMASGRYSDTPGNRTDMLYFGGSTVRETALHWPMISEPGTVFRYANNDTLAAVAAISGTFADHPPAELFAALAMTDTTAETDWQGDYILSSQVWSTAPDLMRLGQLYLNDGIVDGTRILPEGWVDYVSSPSGPQPDGPLGYGAGFWLFNNSEGVPPDTFAAMGNRGQYVVIVPSRDVVIVRRGEDPAGSRFDIVAFTRDVLVALEE